MRGWGFKVFASESVAKTKAYLQSLTGSSDLGSPKLADQIVADVGVTVLLIGRTVAETQLAAQELEFETEKSVNYLCSLPNVRRTVACLRSRLISCATVAR